MFGACAKIFKSQITHPNGVVLRTLASKKPKKKQSQTKDTKETKSTKKDTACDAEKQGQSERKKAAIILAGCGFLDGTDVHEASAVAVSLSRKDLTPVFYAPNAAQAVVMDHMKRCPMCENRSVLTESARIARGKIHPLSDLQHTDVSCIVVPGGFGVAQTLSTFEKEKECCTIDAELMRVLEEFHDVKKPMGFICIAAILPAKMFPCVKITLGMKDKSEMWPYQDVIEAAAEMGAEVENRQVDQFSFDKQHMVFTTPAFMYAGPYHEIFDGIGRMIENMCYYTE